MEKQNKSIWKRSNFKVKLQNKAKKKKKERKGNIRREQNDRVKVVRRNKKKTGWVEKKREEEGKENDDVLKEVKEKSWIVGRRIIKEKEIEKRLKVKKIDL